MRTLLLSLLFIFIIIGCGQPEPEAYPEWYTNPPKTTTSTLYSIAIDTNETTAKHSAELVLRSELLKGVQKDFTSKNHPINQLYTKKDLPELKKALKYHAARLRFEDTTIEEVALKPEDETGSNTANNDEDAPKITTMVLISVDSETLFKSTKKTLNAKITLFQQRLSISQQQSALHAYMVLKEIQNQKTSIVFHAELLRILDPSFSNKKYFKFLYEMDSLYEILKKEINLSIISDANAISFVKPIKKALKAQGLQVSSMKMNAPRSYKLLLTSAVKNDTLYGFKVQRIQITSRLQKKSKQEVAKNVTVFEGKSRYDAKDARKHALEQYKTQIKQQGIFTILGISSTIKGN